MIELHLGDCLEILPTIPSESVDAVITDPPYPCIKRDYGTWTVDEWWDMMMGVCAETRRILKPTGSAVFILQPNSEKVGKMRGWLWEFMAWVCRDWNMVQDAWWWNFTMVPTFPVSLHGMLRPSIKAQVWAGNPRCYRNQELVLWDEADATTAARKSRKCFRTKLPSGHQVHESRMSEAAIRRSGVSPFNLMPLSSNNSDGHPASTPLKLADWWTRYICPPGGTVADWFMGSGTMGIAAVENGCNFVGIECKADYFAIAEKRIADAQMQPPLMEVA